MSIKESRVAPEAHRVHANGIDIHYLDQGKGEPLVLLHGLADKLAGAGVTPDAIKARILDDVSHAWPSAIRTGPRKRSRT